MTNRSDTPVSGESHPVNSEELRQMRCPRCGDAMSHGYIAGKSVTLRWTADEETYTSLAGEAEKQNSLVHLAHR
jgi:hypothetical protein